MPQNDNTLPPVKRKPRPAKVDQTNPLDDLTQFNQEDLVKGVVFSLILDKPKCKQRGRW